MGQKLVFRVTRYDEASGRPDLILSRRMILEEEQAVNAEVTRSRLTVGAVLPGKVTTVEGAKLKITKGSNGVKVDKANVVATDVVATNGVIHVIDSVVIPN